MANLTRIEPLADQIFAGNSILIKPDQARTRVSLRASATEIPTINKTLGLKLPTQPKSVTSSRTRTAMWLGPDEWLIIDDEKSDLHKLESNLSDTLCAVVDISHRNTAIILTGKNVVNVLNTGCPQDLSLEAFGVGACTRTILGKSEVILWRTSQDSFHLECWRSFSQYVWKFLVEAANSA